MHTSSMFQKSLVASATQIILGSSCTMTIAFELALSLVMIVRFGCGSALGKGAVIDLENLKIDEEPRLSNYVKRSPLEVGFVSFELDHRQTRNYDIPALVRPANVISKRIIPVVSKSRTISTTSTISNQKGPKNDHSIVPLGNDHIIIQKLHPSDPKIIVDHKELLVDHAAKVILDQKHQTLVIERKPLVLSHNDNRNIIINHPNTHTVIFEHKPVLIDHGEHETNVLIHSMPKTLVLEHKPITVTDHRPKTIVLGTSRTILLSPKTQIHEIIVHRHVPKAVEIRQTVDEDRNPFRSHSGGFGVGLDYGGHGAGHGFHVPVI